MIASIILAFLAHLRARPTEAGPDSEAVTALDAVERHAFVALFAKAKTVCAPAYCFVLLR
jgi:hypothetical protein